MAEITAIIQVIRETRASSKAAEVVANKLLSLISTQIKALCTENFSFRMGPLLTQIQLTAGGAAPMDLST